VSRTLLSLLGLVASACASPPRHWKLDLPREEIAELRELDQPSESFGLPRPACRIQLEAIDGESLEGRFAKGLPQIVDLRPGQHEIRCRYRVKSLGGPLKTGSSDLRIAVQAGHVYQLGIDWGMVTIESSAQFTIECRDITARRKQDEIEKCRQEEAEARRRAEARAPFEPF